ncbi:hypothetical protein BLNAU_7832 [Blattamonas nauphoetae]|uniref:Uncharacterized protein n=1 Tax=Blattamonas nauphoetae TaxID=2049346 RepID=A0ABQ9Y0H2_9EUKA|nr:hypothetical protein BLNAU_7832 [Blattamonas nauphoetae]
MTGIFVNTWKATRVELRTTGRYLKTSASIFFDQSPEGISQAKKFNIPGGGEGGRNRTLRNNPDHIHNHHNYLNHPHISDNNDHHNNHHNHLRNHRMGSPDILVGYSLSQNSGLPFDEQETSSSRVEVQEGFDVTQIPDDEQSRDNTDLLLDHHSFSQVGSSFSYSLASSRSSTQSPSPYRSSFNRMDSSESPRHYDPWDDNSSHRSTSTASLALSANSNIV